MARGSPLLQSFHTSSAATQYHTQGVPEPLHSRVKQKADHSPPSSAKVKNEWHYTSTPTYAFLVGTRENFLYLYQYILGFWGRVKS
jgi:hypothetical protein